MSSTKQEENKAAPQQLVSKGDLVYQMLEDLFGQRWRDVWVASVPGDPNAPEHQQYFMGGRAGKERLYEGDNLYFSGSCVTGRHRRKKDFDGTCILWFDDVGTKSDAHALLTAFGKPRWLVTTSPGNQQWFYKLDRWIMAGQAFILERVLHAAAAQGMTDPGTLDVVRAMRLPGGINGKPKYGTPSPTVVGLQGHTFELNLEQACQALGLSWKDVQDPDWDDGIARSSVSRDTGRADTSAPDQWLSALFELGRVLDTNPKQGVVDIVCPFADEHTQRESSGTAYFGNGAFKCHHGACQGRKNNDYQQRIVDLLDEELAPRGETGLGFLAREAFPAGDLTLEDLNKATAVPADFRERDADDRWLQAHRRMIWVHHPQVYLDTEALDRATMLWPPNAFTSWMAPASEFGKAGVSSAHAQFIGGRRGGLPRTAETMTYQPGAGRWLSGGRVVNMWQRDPMPGLPPAGSVSDNDVQVYLDHVLYVFDGIAPAADLMLDFMAVVIQKPEVKINWAPLIVGGHGTGKDTMLLPLVRALGPTNVSYIGNAQLVSDFNDWLLAELVVVEELAQKEKAEVYNGLKDKLAAPPLTVSVNQKFQPRFNIPNLQSYVFLSNHDNAIAVDPEDRRLWVFKSSAAKRDPAYFGLLIDWLELGGAEKVIRWLMDRDVSKFTPKTCPPDTLGHKVEMSIAASSPGVKWVLEQFEAGGAFENRSVVALQEIVRHSGLVRPSSGPVSDTIVIAALKAMGGARLNDAKPVRVGSGLKRLWAVDRDAVAALEGLSAAELRKKYEDEIASGA